MNIQFKNKIRQAIEAEITTLGSAARVADKCGLNASFISQMRSGNESTLQELHWLNAARALSVNLSGWVTVETMNGRIVRTMMDTARNHGQFIAISNCAGSGKSANSRDYRDEHKGQDVFYYCVEHANMPKNDFLQRLCKNFGIDTSGSEYMSGNRLADKVIAFLTARLNNRPLLIIDEADKLNDRALCFFISLFNAVEGGLGCVILGTENLERRIKNGVKWQKNGMDEIDSRFGRRFVTLTGFTLAEVRAICSANGLTDAAAQKRIFEECEPQSVVMAGQSMKVLRDLRPLRRKIEREIIRINAGEGAAQ